MWLSFQGFHIFTPSLSTNEEGAQIKNKKYACFGALYNSNEMVLFFKENYTGK